MDDNLNNDREKINLILIIIMFVIAAVLGSFCDYFLS